MKKRLLALFMATVMMFSMVVPAFADDNGDPVLRGVGTVEFTVIESIIPTSLDFTLDPFLGRGGVSQGGNDVFVVGNLTEEDIVMFWQIIFAPGEDVVLSENVDDEVAFDASETDRELRMGVVLASSEFGWTAPDELTVEDILEAIGVTEDGEYVGNSALFLDDDASDPAPEVLILADNLTVNTTLQGVEFGFGLEGLANADEDPVDGDYVAISAFKFYAYMHAFADWSEDEPTVNVAAQVLILPATATDIDFDEDLEGHNAIEAAELPGADLDIVAGTLGMLPPTIQIASSADAQVSFVGNNITVGNARSGRAITLNFYSYGTTTAATNVTDASVTGAPTATVSDNVVTLTFPANQADAVTLTVTAGGVDNIFNVTFVR